MEFPKNIAEQLDGDSVGAIRAWRHQMICKLIEAGVVDPEDLKHTVSSLYDFLVSQPILKTPKQSYLDTETLQVRLEGILHGKTSLDRLRNFVYLLEDEMQQASQKEKHLAPESHNHR